MLENRPKKQAQGAPERHRKMLQKSINNRSFLDQKPLLGGHPEGQEPPKRRKVSAKSAPRASQERFQRKFDPQREPGLRQPALPNPLFTLAN